MFSLWSKFIWWGLRDGSASDVVAMQPWGPEFESYTPLLNAKYSGVYHESQPWEVWQKDPRAQCLINVAKADYLKIQSEIIHHKTQKQTNLKPQTTTTKPTRERLKKTHVVTPSLHTSHTWLCGHAHTHRLALSCYKFILHMLGSGYFSCRSPALLCSVREVNTDLLKMRSLVSSST